MNRLFILVALAGLFVACSPVGTAVSSPAATSSTITPNPFPTPFPAPNPAPMPAPSPGTNPFAVTPLKLGAIGDSISRAYNIEQLNAENPLFSFTTGTSLANSVVNNLKAKVLANGWPLNLVYYNVAVVGDSVLGANSTFSTQSAQLASVSPYMVTVEIGANDLCQGNLSTTATQAQFRDRIVTVLRALTLSANPPAVISIASVPHVFALTQIPGLANNQVCQFAWSLACPNLQIGQVAFEAQWIAANQALAQAAVTLGSSVIYDGGAVANTTFAQADVSAVDCFHPSVNGQGKLAQAVWTTVQAKINQLLPHP